MATDYDLQVTAAVRAFIPEAERLGIKRDNCWGCDWDVYLKPLSWQMTKEDGEWAALDVVLLIWSDGRWGFKDILLNLCNARDEIFATEVLGQAEFLDTTEERLVQVCQDMLTAALGEAA